MVRKTLNIPEDTLNRITALVDLKIYLYDNEVVNDVLRRGLLVIEKENGISRRTMSE